MAASRIEKPSEFPIRIVQREEEESESEDEEELDSVQESIAERLVGLTEMVPERMWTMFLSTANFSYWLLRRSTWVIATSAAILFFPPFIESQRLELVEMQEMHTKQVMLGQGGGKPGMIPGPPPLM